VRRPTTGIGKPICGAPNGSARRHQMNFHVGRTPPTAGEVDRHGLAARRARRSNSPGVRAGPGGGPINCEMIKCFQLGNHSRLQCAVATHVHVVHGAGCAPHPRPIRAALRELDLCAPGGPWRKH
jgi:hypothetical protein